MTDQEKLVHNERRKFLATAFNNVGVGWMVVGFAAPRHRGEHRS
jgi:hypothetical protein